MSDRAFLIDRVVVSAGMAHWHRVVLPADASRRRYLRLIGPDGRTAILMDAPDMADETAQFLRIAAHLRQIGLAAPAVIAADLPAGIVILDDLGPAQFAQWLVGQPGDERTLYLAATDAIVTYVAALPPADLSVLTPQGAAEMAGLYPDWAAPGTPTGRAAFEEALAEAYDRLVSPHRALSLRDFHAENLIWRPTETGLARVGLLDFQDAFLAPATYDLVSLLRDPRRDVAEETRFACLGRFVDKLGVTMADLMAECACVAVQRNLRIAGIFHRLIRRDGKPRYAAFLPRVLAHLERDLAHPALSDLQSAVRALGPVLS